MVKHKKATSNKKKKPSRGFSLFIGKEKEYLIENLAMLVKSGLDVAIALETMQSDIKTKSLHQVITQMRADIESGSTIAEALGKYKFLPDYSISLIRIGEESGRLSENLQVIVLQQQKEREFKSRIRSAMMYPVFVMALTLIVGVGIAWFILPKLATVFNSLKVQLPALTKALIALGNFLQEHGALVIPLSFLVLGLIFYFIFVFKKTKFIGQGMLFRLPAIHGLLQEVEVARFGYLLGTMLEAGLPILQALDSIAQATDFRAYRKFYLFLQQSINDGNFFKASFKLYKKTDKYLPLSVQQIIATAEQSGSLAPALLDIGRIYENKTADTTKNLSVILEPILLVIVWLGVVSVALAVILPIYSLIGGMNQATSQKSAPPPPAIETTESDQSVIDSDTIDTTDSVEVVAATSAMSETSATSVVLPQLKIKDISLGYLNVRSQPTTAGDKIAEVQPGDIFDYTQTEAGWYQINLSAEQVGWVYGDYVEILD